MSCPDWQALCDRRDACDRRDVGPGESAGWQAALEHLDGCSDCQSDAIAADPTLLFRRLPAPEVGADDVEMMQRAVASMRRSAKVERRRPAFALPSAGPWMRAAAVTLVLLGSAMLHGTDPRYGTDPRSEDAAINAELNGVADAEAHQTGVLQAIAQQSSGLAVAGMSAAARSVSRLPLVEMADPSYGSIIEVVDQDISVVVVMPGNLDV